MRACVRACVRAFVRACACIHDACMHTRCLHAFTLCVGQEDGEDMKHEMPNAESGAAGRGAKVQRGLQRRLRPSRGWRLSPWASVIRAQCPNLCRPRSVAYQNRSRPRAGDAWLRSSQSSEATRILRFHFRGFNVLLQAGGQSEVPRILGVSETWARGVGVACSQAPWRSRGVVCAWCPQRPHGVPVPFPRHFMRSRGVGVGVGVALAPGACRCRAVPVVVVEATTETMVSGRFVLE